MHCKRQRRRCRLRRALLKPRCTFNMRSIIWLKSFSRFPSAEVKLKQAEQRRLLHFWPWSSGINYFSVTERLKQDEFLNPFYHLAFPSFWPVYCRALIVLLLNSWCLFVDFIVLIYHSLAFSLFYHPVFHCIKLFTRFSVWSLYYQSYYHERWYNFIYYAVFISHNSCVSKEMERIKNCFKPGSCLLRSSLFGFIWFQTFEAN